MNKQTWLNCQLLDLIPHWAIAFRINLQASKILSLYDPTAYQMHWPVMTYHVWSLYVFRNKSVNQCTNIWLSISCPVYMLWSNFIRTHMWIFFFHLWSMNKTGGGGGMCREAVDLMWWWCLCTFHASMSALWCAAWLRLPATSYNTEQ